MALSAAAREGRWGCRMTCIQRRAAIGVEGGRDRARLREDGEAARGRGPLPGRGGGGLGRQAADSTGEPPSATGGGGETGARLKEIGEAASSPPRLRGLEFC